MQATSSDPSVPVFDELVAEKGNPFGGHADMPVPRLKLGMAPLTDWPSLEDPAGVLPTVEIPLKDFSDASALAELDDTIPAAASPEAIEE